MHYTTLVKHTVESVVIVEEYTAASKIEILKLNIRYITHARNMSCSVCGSDHCWFESSKKMDTNGKKESSNMKSLGCKCVF